MLMYQKGFRETYVDTNHSATFHFSTLNEVKIILKTCLASLVLPYAGLEAL